jgi:hypothetical protein
MLERQRQRAAVSDAYARISPDRVPPNVRIRDWSLGMAPPPVRSKPPDRSKLGRPSGDDGLGAASLRTTPFVKSVAVVTAGLNALGTALTIANNLFRAENQGMAMIIANNDIVGDRMRRRAEVISNINAASAAGGTLAGGALGAAIGTAILPGIGTVAGAAIGAGIGGSAG